MPYTGKNWLSKWAGAQHFLQNCMYAQRRLLSACATAQADKSLRCPPEDPLDPLLPTDCPAKLLIWVYAGRTFNRVWNVLPRLCKIYNDVHRTEYIFIIWNCIRIKSEALRKLKLLMAVPKLFLCCSFSILLCLWFHMWRVFCHYLFLISPSFGASGGLCFVIVAFLGISTYLTKGICISWWCRSGVSDDVIAV